MADDNTGFITKLTSALEARKDWLETSELAKLKDELRSFQTAFSSLYTIFLKKGLINEDPYKQESKVGEIEIPPTGSLGEGADELSIRLSTYDNQLDFLVNFYQFNVEFLNLERIRRIAGLIKYIDWTNLTADSQQPNTRALAELAGQAKMGADQMALSFTNEALNRLNKCTGVILGSLRFLTDYQREAYKLMIRREVASRMAPADAAQITLLRKQFSQALPGRPFYHEFAEEVIREDYSKNGEALQEKALKALRTPEARPKTVRQEVPIKHTLLEGVTGLSAITGPLGDILAKVDANKELLDSRKTGFWERLRRIIAEMMNREPEPVIYELEYMDPHRGARVREKVNIFSFRAELDRKMRAFAGISARGPGMAKLEALEDEALDQFLELNIRDVQGFYKTLSALDDYFKSEASGGTRDRVRGIKPELAALKNAIVKANQKRHEYRAQIEEARQLKRLGVSPGVSGV